ncbi:MAG TPA: DUF2905 domain-containing protein [Deltaproteobacteria bacterium]|nr:MAG: hypothetical protein A2Z79_04680 [Deltaproteobacteria bacterium GWA2_55_82]OGQ61976.1 MAG: hypothetical protein A3I81_13205 [Deltaproteobacteria bacterium RIFCSPLOWO2_02_FULL_55_12]OIJ74671.1 MAG: hypothetical protein A2V21_310590 [Deltaproteobacteria bacterium GWC2_55_46]HBG46385.1 DUF2905 domain-containing protein [Deltaproteobacteria bacterium]HCY10596.1 DUF2905 domain-containing protein [Deltaproteobacteria bacterium]
MPGLGKAFIIIGVALIIIGLLVAYGPRVPFLGKLPGDIYIKRDNFVFYFPLATSVIVSIILTLIIYLFTRR